MTVKAPFVWFGGKRKVAGQVWEALGDVYNYVEPFAGSLAVLLGRPDSAAGRRVETVNDADGFVANFWRACAADPEQVAAFCSGPVNETDLFARHLWLVNTGRERIAQLESDPDWFDAKVAGWWVWGVNAWIGSGWCSGTGPWVHADDPKQRPHLGNAGKGVNRQLPHISNAGKAGFNSLSIREQGITEYMIELAERLSTVRVCAGDWSRVVTNGALSYGATVGVFLDPPYLGDVRASDLYSVDDHHIANDVREWALQNASDRVRVVLAGYQPEHDHLIPDTWRRVRWSSGAAYQTTAGGGQNAANRHSEVLWISPGCGNNAPATLWDDPDPTERPPT